MKKTESFKNIIPLCVFIWTISSCLFDLEGAGLCTKDEYSHSLFKKCVPCSGICKPLSRSDCIRKCPDYIQKLTCPIDHYWHSVYGKCIACSKICSPQNRTTCQSNCGRYIASLKLEDTTTDTVPEPTTYTPETISNWAEEYVVIIISSSVLLIIVASSIALYLCRSKMDRFGRTCKKTTINAHAQETNEQTSIQLIAINDHTQGTNEPTSTKVIAINDHTQDITFGNTSLV